MVDAARWQHIQSLTLLPGSHDPDNQFCVMEAVAFVGNEPWSDDPQCCSPVIAAFCRAWNDTSSPYGPAIRERLKSYIPRLVGSRRSPEVENERAWLAGDWLIRTALATWLRAAGLNQHAERIANLPAQTSLKALAQSAAGRDAARAAARDAARAAARAAARDAAGAAAQDPAGAAAQDAAWDAARDAAGAAARAATWDAAWDAAGAAARAATWDAAGAKIEPTVNELQASAWRLLDQMLAVGTPVDASSADDVN